MTSKINGIEKYRNIDVLLIDDVQFIIRKGVKNCEPEGERHHQNRCGSPSKDGRAEQGVFPGICRGYGGPEAGKG